MVVLGKRISRDGGATWAPIVSGIGELEDAFRRAKAADRTTVIHVPVHPTDWTEGNGSWWECGTPEVSERASVRAARKEHEAGKRKQRVGV